jgi:segregation and condensation protein B
MQLIRIAGRSELPGRPFMYATTPYFLEHFGLRDLNHLEEVNPMLKRRDAAVSVETAQREADPIEELPLADESPAPEEAPDPDEEEAVENAEDLDDMEEDEEGDK